MKFKKDYISDSLWTLKKAEGEFAGLWMIQCADNPRYRLIRNYAVLDIRNGIIKSNHVWNITTVVDNEGCNQDYFS